MRGKREINHLVRQLEKSTNEYDKGLVAGLLWVTKKKELEEISPNAEPFKPYIPRTLDYNRIQYIYKMQDPANPNNFYISYKIPPETPPSWWTKIPSDQTPPIDNISFGNNYFLIPDLNGQVTPLCPTQIDWEDGWVLKDLYPTFFPTIHMTNFYLRQFDLVGLDSRIMLSSEERQELARKLGLGPRNLRIGLENHLNARYIGRVNQKGIFMWIFRKIEPEPIQTKEV